MRLAVIDYDLLLTLWKSEMKNEDMIAALSTTRRVLENAKVHLSLPKRATSKSWFRQIKKRPRRSNVEIGEEELAHRTAQVQATWTDEVFVLRSQGRARPMPYKIWTYPAPR